MAKRSTRIETTKVYKSGEVETILNGNKMNRKMCEEIISRLAEDWENVKKDDTSDIKEIHFKCVD